MKTLLFSACLLLASCVTRTEFLPDGTKVTTESVDNATVNSGLVLVKLIIDSKSGK